MNAEACAGRAQIRLRLGDYVEAAKWAQAALTLNPAHAAARYTLGASLTRLGRTDEGAAASMNFAGCRLPLKWPRASSGS